MPVTATVALVAFAGKVTVAGTVATAVLVELRLTVSPAAGAATERFKVRFCVAVPVIASVVGEKLRDTVT
jgi:hypothetical protein